MAPTGRPANRNLVLVVVGLAIAALIVVVVIRSASSGDSPSHQLTVCESAWQEAQRSAAETGAERDNQLAIKPTLTACDTVAEWDAANIRVHSPLAEGASVVNGLCTKLGATTPLCAEAKQAATPST